MSVRPPHQLSLDEIIHGCRDEALEARGRETGLCFELFRRALDEREQHAWTAIAQQYQRLLLNWLYACSPVPLAQDEAEDMAREALEKFWRTLTPRTPRVADHFEHVGALLKYLNQCAVTTVLDHRRRAQRLQRLQERVQMMQASQPASPSPEETALEELCRDERLQHVRAWVRKEVTDPQEQRILYLSFERDLAPIEIATQYPDEFPSVEVVRRIKERVLKRARRAFEAV